jgi:peptidoglycan/xylan/chitin deacetylase (PgdA/CDA1 family)
VGPLRLGHASLRSDSQFLSKLKLEVGYFTGRARQRRDVGGAGVILRFARILPRRPGAFQPLESEEVTPRFLDRSVRALKRWKYDFVTMDEVCRRAVIMPQRRRFVALTFDGAYKDQFTAAYPILARHHVPFTLYIPTAFPDGVGEPWQLALEKIVAKEKRFGLMINGEEQHFQIRTVEQKYEVFEYIASWMRRLPPPDLTAVLGDLCRRYSIDLAALSRGTYMDWADLDELAADPMVTFGSATVNYSPLSTLKDNIARREMTMANAVVDAALDRGVSHFAYPFGDRDSFRRPHVMMAEEAGFASAASTIAGIVEAEGRTNLRALPRIAWDGRMRSLRAMRVILSGAAFDPVMPTPSKPDL